MNPCVWFASFLCWKMIYGIFTGLSLTGQESERVCSTGVLQEINLDSWEKIQPWK